MCREGGPPSDVPAWIATWEQAANQCCDPRALPANGVRRSREGGAGGGASLLFQGSRLVGGRPAPPRGDWLLWAGLAPVTQPAGRGLWLGGFRGLFSCGW